MDSRNGDKPIKNKKKSSIKAESIRMWESKNQKLIDTFDKFNLPDDNPDNIKAVDDSISYFKSIVNSRTAENIYKMLTALKQFLELTKLEFTRTRNKSTMSDTEFAKKIINPIGDELSASAELIKHNESHKNIETLQSMMNHSINLVQARMSQLEIIDDRIFHVYKEQANSLEVFLNNNIDDQKKNNPNK